MRQSHFPREFSNSETVSRAFGSGEYLEMETGGPSGPSRKRSLQQVSRVPSMRSPTLLRTLSTLLREQGSESAKWYVALHDADCVQVMELLDVDPQLVKRGWKKDSGLLVAGVPWAGRTALHVAVRRGCLALAEKVLRLFADEEIERPTTSSADNTIDKEQAAAAVHDGPPNCTLADLLVEVDGTWMLDALAMAIVHGNQDIVSILKKTSLEYKANPYEVSDVDDDASHAGTREIISIDEQEESRSERPRPQEEEQEDPSGSVTMIAIEEEEGMSKAEVEREAREQLRVITKVALSTNLTKDDVESVKKAYRANKDFNFLPFAEYFFHFSFVFMRGLPVYIRNNRLEIAQECTAASLLPFLLELQDGQGRTPLHVAVDNGSVDEFLAFLRHFPMYDFLNTPDGAGRTPLYRAAATNNRKSLNDLVTDWRTDLNATFCPQPHPWERGLDLNILSTRNGFDGVAWDSVCQSTALHVAIIHRELLSVEILLANNGSDRPIDCILDLNLPLICIVEDDTGSKCFSFHPLQLAVLVGEASIVQLLLKAGCWDDPKPHDLERLARSSLRSNTLPRPDLCRAFHLAATLGNPGVLKTFLDKQDFDPLTEDVDQNTALHYVFKGKEAEFVYHSHLRDCVSIAHVPRSRFQIGGHANNWKGYAERIGCINLLLQGGIDIWKVNKYGQPPCPEHHAPPEIIAWWYERVARETSEEQTKMNSAANAILVTAALVATASYVGPLQPPLGYNGNSMQVEYQLVRVFIVCDTMSFYLAVAAIIMALVPSLLSDLRYTRVNTGIAVGLLFPSIVCVLVAFAAASLVVIPEQGGTWNHGGLTMSTVALGGFVCLAVTIVFVVTFLRVIFHRNRKVRRFYNTVRSFSCQCDGAFRMN